MSEIDASLRAARHRLCRPLPDPPLGLRHADRGDAGGAARRREGGQGPLHRRVVDVRLAVRARRCTWPTGTAGRGSSRMQNHYNLLYREEEREMLPLCADRGHRRDSLEPAGPRPAGPALGRRERPLRNRRVRQDALCQDAEATARSSSAWARSRQSAACRGAGRAGLAAREAAGHRADRRRHEAAASRGRGGRARHQASPRRSRPSRSRTCRTRSSGSRDPQLPDGASATSRGLA